MAVCLKIAPVIEARQGRTHTPAVMSVPLGLLFEATVVTARLMKR